MPTAPILWQSRASTTSTGVTEMKKEDRFKNRPEVWDKRVKNYAPRLGLWPTEENLVNKYFIKKNATVIEIGCGAGRTAIPLAERGFKVVGIDILSKMINAARQKAVEHQVTKKVKFVNADVLKIPIKDNQFDYAFVPYNSLDYIHPPEVRQRAIREIYRVLKPRGRLIHSFHNVLAIHGRLRFWYWTPRNIVGWLLSLNKNGGYRVNKDVWNSRRL